MSQDKAAEIIDLSASRSNAASGSQGEPAGDFLARTRAAKGISLSAVSDAIKIKIDHLEAIETQRPDLLPSTPYAVGFVKSYARYLDLDANALAEQYRRDIGGTAPTPIETAREAQSASSASDVGEGFKMASVLAIVAIIVFAVWVFANVFSKPANRRDNATDRATPIVLSEDRADAPLPRTPENTPSAPVTSQFGTEGYEVGEANTGFDDNAATLANTDTPTAPAGAREAEALSNADSDPAAPVAENAANVESSIEPPAPVASEEPAIDEPALTPQEASPEPLTAPVEEEIARAPVNIVPDATPEPAASEQTIFPAVLTRSTAPDYPAECDRDASELESVTVMFDVGVNGRAANPRVISSTNACFEAAAVNTLARWRFNPKSVDGARVVEAGKRATLNFRK